jgi:predicted RecB family nuclease
VDLHPIVRNHVYHPGFAGSFSLKAVAPALVPGFGYQDLSAIADGSAAAQGLLRLASGGVDPAEDQQLREALLAYCERDTLALVEVSRAMFALAER